MIVIPFGLLGVTYIGYRAFSLPDVGSQFPPTILKGEPLPPDENAAEDYRKAGGMARAEVKKSESGTVHNTAKVLSKQETSAKSVK